MFFESSETEGKKPTTLEESAKAAKESVEGVYNPKKIMDDVYSINQRVSEMVRNTLGQGGVMIRELEKNITRATQETLKFGVGAEENIKLYSSLSEAFRVNVILSNEQAVNMQAIATAAGITQEEMSKIVEGFDTMGMTTIQATKQLELMNKQARLYGLNTAQFMDVVGTNIKKLSMFDFKNGVQGFTNMVAKAQTLRIDVEKTFAIAEDLLEPEKAMELAATFSTLGGEFSKLDFGTLFNMAQNDVEGLQDAIVNAAGASATFNQETKKFELSRTQMLNLREAAKALNISTQEMTELAIKQAEVTRNQDMLKNMLGFTEEQRNLLSNIAQVGEDGRLKLSIDGDLVDVQRESAKVIEELKKKQDDAGKESLPIAEQQLGVLQQINASIQSGAFETVVKIMSSDTFENLNTTLKDGAIEMGKTLKEVLEDMDPEPVLKVTVGEFATYIQKLTQWVASSPSDTSRIPVSPFAEGGIVSGPTHALVGEYPSAGINNPEVIAPLNDLVNILAEVMPTNNPIEDIIVNVETPKTDYKNDSSKLDIAGGFDINLKLNDIKLPPNISTEKIASELVQNQEFMRAIVSAANGNNKTYRSYT